MEEKPTVENEKITKKLIQIFEKESDAAKKEDADENKPETAAAEYSSSQAGPSSRSSSPEPNCAICLESLQNKSFTDSCFHTFCFTCLVEWSKVKPECPLCKQKFKSIVHNVQKDLTFEEYHITSQPMVDSLSDQFRFRTIRSSVPGHMPNIPNRMREVMMLHRMQFAPHTVITAPPSASSSSSSSFHSSTRSTLEFRRRVYMEGLWVKRPSLRQVRAASPDFFHRNPACVHRLLPWLQREMEAILGPFRRGDSRRLMNHMLAELQRIEISSPEFAELVRPVLGPQTSHFLYEFQSFASSPCTMEMYDRTAEYSFLPSTHPSQHLIIPPLYPDRAVDMSIHPPRALRRRAPGLVPAEEDDDCLVVGVVPPRSERTPEVVELSSDDEVVIDVSSDSSPPSGAPGYPRSPISPYSIFGTSYGGTSPIYSRSPSPAFPILRTPSYSPVSPGYSPHSPSTAAFSSPSYVPVSPSYSPESPSRSPVPSTAAFSSPSYAPVSPIYSPPRKRPTFSPTSPSWTAASWTAHLLSSDSDVECVYQGKKEPQSPTPSTSRKACTSNSAAPERPRLASAIVMPPRKRSKTRHTSRHFSDSDESNTSNRSEKPQKRVKKLRLNRVGTAPSSSSHRAETSRDSSSHHSSYKLTVAFKKHKKKKHKDRKKHTHKHKRRDTDSN